MSFEKIEKIAGWMPPIILMPLLLVGVVILIVALPFIPSKYLPRQPSGAELRRGKGPRG